MALALCACALLATLMMLERAATAHAAAQPEAITGELSCDDELPAEHESLAWCSDGASPMCIPALPPHPGLQLWDGPPALSQAMPVLSRTVTWLRPLDLPLARPHAERVPRTRHLEPLERPPRA